jgi:uncharacterized protein YdaU (DUF1376 family)
MSKLPVLPLFVDAYLADTGNLTLEENGAYLLLLMAMWRRNGSIPNDDIDLARLLRTSPKRWSQIKLRIMPFLMVNQEGELSQKRLAHEWHYANEKVEINRKNGSQGGRPRRVNTRSVSISVSNEINDLAKANGSVVHNPNHNRNETILDPDIDPDKKRKEDASSSKKFSFVHGCIRLTEKDLLSWVRAYPHISVEGELIAMEGWLASRGKGRWFFAASNRLAKLEREQAVALAKAAAEGTANGDGGYRYRDPMTEGF